MIRVLSIGTDETIFETASASFARQKAYAEQLGELTILIPTVRYTEPVRSQGLSVYPVNASRAPHFGKLWSRLRIASCVRSFLREGRFDVVTVQDPFETGLLTLYGMRGYTVPLHVQLHTDFLSPAFARHSLINAIRVHIARFVLKRASRIRVVSGRLMNQLTMLDLGVPVSVLPIFVDIAKYRDAMLEPELSSRFAIFKTRLLVVSRLESEKNVALAVKSFATAAPKDSCLVIVGAGSERIALEALAKELNVAARVFFEGAQEGARYYLLADLVLVPSHYEGYGRVIIEALAAGKPVLSTDVGVAREAGAIVTSPGDFVASLAVWFAQGPRSASLANYPYSNFDAYVRAYCDDIRACASPLKGE